MSRKLSAPETADDQPPTRSSQSLPNPTRLITQPVVLKRSGHTRSGLYRAMDAGEFPRPVAISKKSRRWVEHEVDAWIQARIDDRDAKDKPS